MECNKQRVEHLKKASKHLNIASSLSCGKIWKANPLCGTRIKEDHYLYEKECAPPRGGKRKSLFKKKRTKKRKSRKKRRRTKRKRGYGGKSPKRRKRGYRRKSPKRRKRGYGGKSPKRRKKI